MKNFQVVGKDVITAAAVWSQFFLHWPYEPVLNVSCSWQIITLIDDFALLLNGVSGKGKLLSGQQTNRLVLYKKEFCPSEVLALNEFEWLLIHECSTTRSFVCSG